MKLFLFRGKSYHQWFILRDVLQLQGLELKGCWDNGYLIFRGLQVVL